MTDRLVRKISPNPDVSEAPKPFSTYSQSPNIVLLGDPGAGKSHLFRSFAHVEQGARLLSTRDFLNLDVEALRHPSVLFIDALDEKRSGRGDQTTVDAMVAKLCLVKPARARIACRAADWLGETDLVAFQAYFDGAGGTIVLSLDPLSEEEMKGVLCAHGITQPDDFLSEAKRRGLEELLTNPQNLTMLADVVQKTNWPASRSELYDNATELLLAEHNSAHTRRESGRYSASELRDATGAICAVRLISDVDGLCLGEAPLGSSFPSYRSISLADKDKVVAALGRRVFVAGAVPETVDYAHRTIAEYLAASWLAAQVRRGLPIGRVRALIGIDGRPASELRGLHAWLSIFLPEHAATIIDADAFGVLSYGDAASLATNQRTYLLGALARLSTVDPWFRSGNWSLPAVAALSSPDMSESFRKILKNEDAGFTLRSIVLEALAVGPPALELSDELLHVMLSNTSPYSERDYALDALLRVRPEGVRAVITAYSKLATSIDDLRMRAAILVQLYGSDLGSAEVAAVLNEALEIDQELVGGAFWYLHNSIPDADIGAVLDQLIVVRARSTTRQDRRNATEVLHVIDNLLTRFLSSHQQVDGDRLWKWLHLRHRCGDHYNRPASNELKDALAANKPALRSVASAATSLLPVDKHIWSFLNTLSEASFHTLDNSILLPEIVAALEQANDAKRKVLFELALILCLRMGTDALSVFERLLTIAEGDASLQSLRDSCCLSPIPDWKLEDSQRRQEDRARRDIGRARNQEKFQASKDAIRGGAHFGWLAWIGAVYFCRFTDMDDQVGPHDRLTTELGDENALVAREGLLNLVVNGQITALSEVVRMDALGKYHKWWFSATSPNGTRREPNSSSRRNQRSGART